jgi:hypothetical protein
MTNEYMPETGAIKTESHDLVVVIDQQITTWGRKIDSSEKYEAASRLLSDVKTMASKIENHFKDFKKKANELHKSICASEKKHLEPLVMMEGQLKPLMSAYVIEQKRIEEENERIRRAEAEKIANERAEAERKRIEEERLAQAEEYEKLGFKDEADKILNVPVVVAPDVVVDIENTKPQTKLKNDFVSHKTVYKLPDMSKLNKVAGALGKECKIPGTVVEAEVVMMGRKAS